MTATFDDREHVRRRALMVERDLTARSLRDGRVLAAMGSVARESVPPAGSGRVRLRGLRPCRSSAGQTISQPYIVALMAEAAELGPGGPGAGDRHRVGLRRRRARPDRRRGLDGRAARGAGRRGRAERLAAARMRQRPRPCTATARSAGPRPPRSTPSSSRRAARSSPRRCWTSWRTADGWSSPSARPRVPAPDAGPGGADDELRRARTSAPCASCPLIGAQGWASPSHGARRRLRRRCPRSCPPPPGAGPTASPRWCASGASRSTSIDDADLGPLLERIGDCSVVLLGEASHGTSEFYRMRGRITRELIVRKRVHRRRRRGRLARRGRGSTLRPAPTAVAAARRDRSPGSRPGCGAITRCADFVEWLRDHNAGVDDPRPPGQLLRPRPLQPLHLDRARCSPTSTGSIPPPRRRPARATAA